MREIYLFIDILDNLLYYDILLLIVFFFIYIDRIMLLRQYFPYSASSSVLVANLCWEYVLAWKKSVYDIKALDAALACIRAIPSSHLKQGFF